MIHDGSSFGRTSALSGTFPGRFTTIRLLRADRGYPSVAYFEAVAAHGGTFIVRLTRSYDPWVRTAWVGGHRATVTAPIRLSRFLAQHAGQCVDLDVPFQCGPRLVSVRVVVLPGRDAAMTRLCTNLPRTPFSLDLVARLYRFRWQIELCFKEWKSYANLHQFDTANAHIAEGLIWASLCAAVLTRFLAHAAQRMGATAMSTRRVAMCAHHMLDGLVAALLLGVGLRGTALPDDGRRGWRSEPERAGAGHGEDDCRGFDRPLDRGDLPGPVPAVYRD